MHAGGRRFESAHLHQKKRETSVSRFFNYKTAHKEFKGIVFEFLLAQAKALLRAGEWGFAKREFMRAFKLFRGEPFKKMYDDWSDDKRLEVLFSYEKEVKSFADKLIKRGRKEEAEKLLKKAKRIVPDIDIGPQT